MAKPCLMNLSQVFMTKKLSLRITPDAKNDLIKIRQFTISHWGKEQSNSYLSELRKKIRLLTGNPAIGMERTDLGTSIFSFPHTSHMIYYTLDTDQLVVFAILHQSMVPTNHLEERNIKT